MNQRGGYLKNWLPPGRCWHNARCPTSPAANASEMKRFTAQAGSQTEANSAGNAVGGLRQLSRLRRYAKCSRRGQAYLKIRGVAIAKEITALFQLYTSSQFCSGWRAIFQWLS
jgi:hypothetical protein